MLETDEHCQVREALRAAERTLDKRRKERTITKQGGWGRKLSTSVSKKKSDRREHDLVRVRVYGLLLVTYAWEPKKRVTEGNTISSESGFTGFY